MITLKRTVAVISLSVLSFAGTSTLRADDAAPLFKSKCAICHGASGAGDAGMGKSLKVRDLGSADVQKQSDDELTSVISKGKNKMPAYAAKLSPDEVKGLVTFIRSLKK